MNNTIVISAVNLVDGGTFSILLDCLENLSKSIFSQKYRIIALVHKREIMPFFEGVEYIEYPKAKKRYILRLYYEYYSFRKLSKRLSPILWLSLHDMSPRVYAQIQAVYMHNPTPFYKPKLRDWKYVPINAIWAYIYKYLYRINIHSNNYLIVQQQWLRKEFSKMFKFPETNIIVARPLKSNNAFIGVQQDNKSRGLCTFIYPAYPRVFKNFDVICEAAKILFRNNVEGFKIILTIDGSENKYSRYLVDKYKFIPFIDFHGIVSKQEIFELYNKSDCLVFPSKLETWGLPLSEFKVYNKPIIVSDLPYAHESVAGAKMVRFFDPDNADELADMMIAVAKKELREFSFISEININKPTSDSWAELFKILLSEHS